MKNVDKNLINEIYDLSENSLKNGIQSAASVPLLEFATIFALYYGRSNEEIIDFSHYILENYDMEKIKSSCFYQLFVSVYASTLKEVGETEEALEIYGQVNLKHVKIPEYMHYYVRIRLMLIQSEFLIFKGNKEKAKVKLQKIKNLSQLLQFVHFYNCATELEKTIQVSL